jgi:hypothetical protein
LNKSHGLWLALSARGHTCSFVVYNSITHLALHELLSIESRAEQSTTLHCTALPIHVFAIAASLYCTAL